MKVNNTLLLRWKRWKMVRNVREDCSRRMTLSVNLANGCDKAQVEKVKYTYFQDYKLYLRRVKRVCKNHCLQWHQ